MTLTDILKASLDRLDRASDAQTLKYYEPKFKQYCNSAVQQIAEQLCARRKENIAVSSGVFTTASLARFVTKIVEVRVDGTAVTFTQDYEGSIEYIIEDTDATSVDVIYQFVPKELINPFDVPEVPEQYHAFAVNYVVACDRAGGDIRTQGAASIDFQLFITSVQKVAPVTRKKKFSHFFN